jgi:protein arginine kinase activator
MNPKSQKCRKCGQPATHKITKIVKGKTHDIFLCDEHAQSFSPYLQVGKPKQSQLVELLQQVLKQQEKVGDAMDPEIMEGPEARSCPNCGLQFGAYKKTLLLGCSECYKMFEDLLLGDMRKIHGAVAQDPQWIDNKDDMLEAIMSSESAASVDISAEPDQDSGEEPQSEDDLQIGDIRFQLEKAITAEDFQEAARLRDKIREMEEILEQKEEQEDQ